MAQRVPLPLLAAVVGSVLLLVAAAGIYQYATLHESENVVRFDQAEFVASDARRPPDDRAAWQVVSLPDQWRTRPDSGEHGWYRIKLNLDPVPEGLQYVLVHHRRARRVSFFVNGVRAGGARDVQTSAEGRAGRGVGAPLDFAIPPSLLHSGQNIIHMRMDASAEPARIDGLGRVYFGDARPLRRLRVWRTELNFQARRAANVMALAAGIIALFLWFARRTDPVMLWFSVACLPWGLLGITASKMRLLLPVELSSVLYTYVSYGLVVPTMILSMRTVDLRWPKFESALWLFFLFELSYPLWRGPPWPGASLVWDATNTILLLGAVGIILHAAPRPLHWPTKIQLIALITMAAFMAYEFARYFGWVDVEGPVTRHYHVPVMLVAMGVVCFERHARAMWQTARINAELERRVTDKVREIEANRIQVQSVLGDRVLTDERQRILSDMHDGLGATLVSLLRYVQSGSADAVSIRRRVRDGLQEMRAAINALQRQSGELTVVLGDLRARLEGLIAGSSLRLDWRVDELPETRELKPSEAFSIQRIVLEAVGNVLKHSDARHLRFIATANGGDNVEIRVEDDGKGFDPAQTGRGLGLANMRARAERIGAEFSITSPVGGGTVVQLTISVRATGMLVAHSSTDSSSASIASPSWAARIPAIVVSAATMLLVANLVQTTEAAVPTKLMEFDRAHFLVSDARLPPGDVEPWIDVELPDQWRARPGIGGQGWYRVVLTLDHAPRGMHLIMIQHRRADGIALFVNRNLVGTAKDIQSMSDRLTRRGMGTAVRHQVPPKLLRPGENVIHVRVDGSVHPALMHGLGRVYFGDARSVRRITIRFTEFGFQSKRDLIFMALAAGLIAFFLWLARKSDPVMLWFCITCLSWGSVGFIYLMWRWSDLIVIAGLLDFYLVYGLVVPVLILSLRTVELKWPKFEVALWTFFALEITYPWWANKVPIMYVFWDAANTVLLLVAVVTVSYGARRPLEWPIRFQIAALFIMAVVMSYELFRFLGWVDVESVEIRHYHVPLMLMALGAMCFDRHARTIREAERTTVELEWRAAEKVKEIEAGRAEIEEALRERALIQERQRILADMHNGLGTSLVSLLHYVDSTPFELASVERRVREALQEMRAAIDALQPHGGELAAVLGGLRERLDGLMAGSGVRLVWQVDHLPQVDELTPSMVFSLQSIVLGAVDNALKHSGAAEVRFVARETRDGAVEIRVEDNGRGFDPARVENGSSLADLRSRAQRLGAGFGVTSQPGRGTVVWLTLARRKSTGSPGSAGGAESVPLQERAGYAWINP